MELAISLRIPSYLLLIKEIISLLFVKMSLLFQGSFLLVFILCGYAEKSFVLWRVALVEVAQYQLLVWIQAVRGCWNK